MATLEIDFLQNQLEERKRRLEDAIALAPQNAGFAGLLREVDSALERMGKGNYGLCEECHAPVEQDRLLADPLVRYCLDHLTQPQRPPCSVTLISRPRCSANCCHNLICG